VPDFKRSQSDGGSSIGTTTTYLDGGLNCVDSSLPIDGVSGSGSTIAAAAVDDKKKI